MRLPLSSGWIPLALGILSFLPYANSLGFDFVWDDRALILENPQVQDIRLLGQGLVSDYWKSPDHPQRARFFYRPLVTISFFLDYSLWGENAFGFHATNLILHVLSVLLVYACFSILADRELAFVSAALFAVHPVHTESVTWISGRTDLLASMLVLASFLCYLSISRRGSVALRGAVCLFYLLAMLSKEVAIVFPGIIALHFLLFCSQDDARWPVYRNVLWSLVGIGLTYSAVRVVVLELPLWIEASRPVSQLIFNLPRILSRYLLKLVVPAPLHAHDPLPWASYDQWPGVVLALVPLLAMVLAVRWLGKRDRNALLGGAWLLIFILPVLNAGAFTDVLVAERFLYLPSVGFCWILASGYGLTRRVEGWHLKAQVAALVLVVVSGVWCWQRNFVWRNDLVLFEEIHRTSPDFVLPHRVLAMTYQRLGRPQDAITELGHVLERSPGDCGLVNDLALAYLDLGVKERSGPLLDAGFAMARRGVQTCPKSDVLHHTLGEYFLRQRNVGNNIELALLYFRNAIELNPTRAAYYYEIASILIGLGRTGEARPYLVEYIRLAPQGERRQQAMEWLEQ